MCLRGFDTFISRNNFTGHKIVFLNDIKNFIKTSGQQGEPASHLLSAALALGAMEVRKTLTMSYETRYALRCALSYYTRSIKSLRETMASDFTGKLIQRTNILWTTFFLGIFEVWLAICYTIDSLYLSNYSLLLAYARPVRSWMAPTCSLWHLQGPRCQWTLALSQWTEPQLLHPGPHI